MACSMAPWVIKEYETIANTVMIHAITACCIHAGHANMSRYMLLSLLLGIAGIDHLCQNGAY